MNKKDEEVAAFIAAKMVTVAESLEPKLLEVRQKYLDNQELLGIQGVVDGVMLDTALILIDPAFRAVWAKAS